MINKKEWFWWLLPIVVSAAWAVSYLSYNFLSSHFTFALRDILLIMLVLCVVALPIYWVVGVTIFGCYVASKRPVLNIAKVYFGGSVSFLVSLFFVSTFIVKPIDKLKPPPKIDPLMQTETFSETAWHSEKLNRRKMTGDLANRVLQDKTCSEVQTLLGTSLDENFGTSKTSLKCNNGSMSELRYFLGSLGMFGEIDSIQIFFDEAGIYSHFEIYSYYW